MTYEKYEKRRAEINKWFNKYIKDTFTTINQFGHLEKHINKSDDYLKKRCMKEKINVSTFIGEELDILEMILNEILNHREELIEYLADIEDNDVWEISGKLNSSVTGKAYLNSPEHKWEDGAISCKTFKICFKKNVKNPNCIIITSAYPY